MQAGTNAAHRAGLGSNKNEPEEGWGSKKAERCIIFHLFLVESGKEKRKKRPAETRMVKTDIAEVVNFKKNKRLMVLVRKAECEKSISLTPFVHNKHL